MNVFADIHVHALYGVDDGAKDPEEMKGMISEAYSQGIRYLCFTPHFHPGYYGRNTERSFAIFSEAREYAKKEYPDLNLYLGNELHYEKGCAAWVNGGECRSLNGTGYVLVDFSSSVPKDTVFKGIRELLGSGYHPIIAHAERYSSLFSFGSGSLLELKSMGALIQIDAGSLFSEFGFFAKIRSKKMLKTGLADLVSSDGHGIKDRPIEIKKAYEYISGAYGSEYADELCKNNPLRVLEGQHIGKV